MKRRSRPVLGLLVVATLLVTVAPPAMAATDRGPTATGWLDSLDLAWNLLVDQVRVLLIGPETDASPQVLLITEDPKDGGGGDGESTNSHGGGGLGCDAGGGIDPNGGGGGLGCGD